MNTLDLLKSAIKEKKSISFEYTKLEKIQGKRIGDPYAVFTFTNLKGDRSTKVHILQTGGVSDSKLDKPFPDFRMFDLEDIDNIEILNSQPSFAINYKYNSLWEGYNDAIAKI